MRLATILLGLYVMVWIALEGNVARATVLAVASTLVGLGHLFQRFLGGQSLGLWAWMVASATFGLASGLSSTALTLVYMAVKTGLHAHGPEFSPAEITWVIGQLPWWSGGGMLAGLGLGLVLASLRRP